MKVTLYADNKDPREFTGVEKVEQVNDVAMLDGITHTNVQDMQVVAE